MANRVPVTRADAIGACLMVLSLAGKLTGAPPHDCLEISMVALICLAIGGLSARTSVSGDQ